MDLQLFISWFILKQGSSIDVSFCLNWVIILQIQPGNFQVGLQLIIYIVLPVGERKNQVLRIAPELPLLLAALNICYDS